MLTVLLALLVWLLVLGVIYWLVTLLPIPDPMAPLVRGVFIVILIVLILTAVFGTLPVPGWLVLPRG